MGLFNASRWARSFRIFGTAVMVSVMLASFQLLVQAKERERPVENLTFYRTA
jgi:hypothetical protein